MARAQGIADLGRRGTTFLRQPRQRRLVIILVVSLAVFVSAFVALGKGGTASTTDAAVPVPPGMVGAFVEAAHSCPALTPPRLAGQVMEASGFTTTGELTELTAEEWEIWAPRSRASRQSARDYIIRAGPFDL